MPIEGRLEGGRANHVEQPRSSAGRLVSGHPPLRGLIEGFYGRPWSRRDRLDLLQYCAERGMNAYVYAPKDDPKHRSQWREEYSSPELDHFRDVERHCRELGMAFGFALSPGLDIDWSSTSDRARLLDKLRAARDLGIGWLLVAFDDLPGRKSGGSAQADLVAWLHQELAAGGSDTRLSLVPTEYAGITSSAYLSDLAQGLPADVDVAWTGRWVVSPTITAADAKARAAALGGRPPLLWDNYPVNDNHMSRSLFLGPYVGRDPALVTACAGVLCNPMPQAHASKVALGTAAAFFGRGERYRPQGAWRRVIREVAGDKAAVLEVLAEACADSALVPARDLALHRLLDRYEARGVSLTHIAQRLKPARDAASLVLDDPAPVWREVGPWLGQLHLEARAGLAAVRLLDALERGEGVEIADAAQGLQAAWDRARSGKGLNVFGPRFASYPIITCDADGGERVDLEAGIVEDASAIDRLCRMARRAYIEWSERPGQVVGL